MPGVVINPGHFFCLNIWFCGSKVITFAMIFTTFTKRSKKMLEIDFKSGDIYDNPCTGEGSFTLFRPGKPAEELKIKKVFQKHTETDVEECSFGFVREHSTGEIYAVAFDSPVKGNDSNQRFMQQFTDWVVLEQDDVDAFGFNFVDMIHGFLPDWWKTIMMCKTSGRSMKHKNSKEFISSWQNFKLKFSNQKGGTYLLTRYVDNIPSPVCIFSPNEVIFPI